MEMAELKSRILRLLKEDEEFRYAVAGLIGLEEILKRLDRHEEELKKLREDMIRGFERHDKEIAELRQEMNRLREDMVKGFERHDKELARLREDMVKGFERYDRELARLREDMMKGFERHDIELERLREDFNRAFEAVDRRLSRVERTLEKLTLDVEDEARSIVRHRLKEELGLDVELNPLILPDLELNIYGTAGEVCIVGEASVRAGISVLKDLIDKLEDLKNKHPDKLKPKTILIIYTSLATPELVEEARKKNIWILKANQDYYKPNLKALSS